MHMGDNHHCHYYLPSLCFPGSLSTMSAAPASNGVFVVIPPNNASGLCPPPAILPTSMCQPPGIMQFEEPPLGAQTPRATQPPDLQPVETFLTGEPKVLGTVQILIGLIHLSFGSVLLMVRRGHVGIFFTEGGVPFWGGACFIISGSLSVAAKKNHTSCLHFRGPAKCQGRGTTQADQTQTVHVQEKKTGILFQYTSQGGK
ncbi:membrane-spanning 4-domains subfamily A member 15 isoform X6 [Pan troglodytes]|uniref:membrane-spanning 4-domains subfamily A member 15 isoform X6 n=1 Tax=Pan troglodytes TaxID=9598 RepID=UPI0030134203